MTFFEIARSYGDSYTCVHRAHWFDMWIMFQGFYDPILVCVLNGSGGEYRFSWNPDPDDLLADDWEVFE